MSRARVRYGFELMSVGLWAGFFGSMISPALGLVIVPFWAAGIVVFLGGGPSARLAQWLAAVAATLGIAVALAVAGLAGENSVPGLAVFAVLIIGVHLWCRAMRELAATVSSMVGAVSGWRHVWLTLLAWDAAIGLLVVAMMRGEFRPLVDGGKAYEGAMVQFGSSRYVADGSMAAVAVGAYFVSLIAVAFMVRRADVAARCALRVGVAEDPTHASEAQPKRDLTR